MTLDLVIQITSKIQNPVCPTFSRQDNVSKSLLLVRGIHVFTNLPSEYGFDANAISFNSEVAGFHSGISQLRLIHLSSLLSVVLVSSCILLYDESHTVAAFNIIFLEH